MFKIIFLDIDGVLNVISQGHDEFGSLFHKHFEDNLRYIIQETNAKIVISSTWRRNGLTAMQSMWKKRKLAGEVIDITPNIVNVDKDNNSDIDVFADRGYEIQEWLNNNKVDSYCIIDDDSDMLISQMDNFVKTSGNHDHYDCIDIGYGLTKKCSELAIKILNKNNETQKIQFNKKK